MEDITKIKIIHDLKSQFVVDDTVIQNFIKQLDNSDFKENIERFFIWFDIWDDISEDNLPEMTMLKERWSMNSSVRLCWAESQCQECSHVIESC